MVNEQPFPLVFDTPPRILVVGDLMLDRYIYGSACRLSPEAPVPVVKFEHEQTVLGGSGNVINNLLSLGAHPIVAGRRGQDDAGNKLLQNLSNWGTPNDRWIITDPNLQTITKIRILAQNQQLLRIDREDNYPLTGELLDQTIEHLTKIVPSCSAVIISDYAKGFCVAPLLSQVIEVANKQNIPVLVDPKGRDWERYHGASLMTPNRKEAEEIIGTSLSPNHPEQLRQAAKSICDTFQVSSIVITLGADGMFVYHTEHPDGVLLPTVARHVFDVSGAGDTVIATIALGLLSSHDLVQAAHLGNIAAGIVVGEPGVAVGTRAELALRLLEETHASPKILPLFMLAEHLSKLRTQGKKIVFTNGIFDLFHHGHVKHLKQAHELGDVLVVGVNSDASVRRVKQDPQRPYLNQHDRVQMLAAMDGVDFVTIFDEDQPLHLLEVLKPDVLVKGDNYRLEEVVGREVVKGYGGRVELLPLPDDLTLTGFIEGRYHS